MTTVEDLETNRLSEPILRLIELHRQSIPVPAGLRAAATEVTSNSLRREFFKLADTIERGGYPTGAGPSEWQDLIAGAITVDDRDSNGSVMLAPRLTSFAIRQTTLRQIERRLVLILACVCLICFFGGLCCQFIVSIMHETMQVMIRDFEIPIDSATDILLRIFSWLGTGVMIVSGFLGAMTVWLAFVPWKSALERMVYFIPLVGPAMRRTHLAMMCDHIRGNLAAGQTYPRSLRAAASLNPSQTLRAWLGRTTELLERGGTVFQAVDRIPVAAEVLPALVGPVGPEPARPAVGWGIAADYFYEAAMRGSYHSRLLISFATLFAALLGWAGMVVGFAMLTVLLPLLTSF